jgi:hypothetical protein
MGRHVGWKRRQTFIPPKPGFGLLAKDRQAVQSMPMVTSGSEFVGVLSVYYRTPGIPVERQSAISDRFLTDAADLSQKRLRGRTEY